MSAKTSDHAVKAKFSQDGIDLQVVCTNRGADCHYVCAEGCEEWGTIVRDEAGAVIGHETDHPHVTHTMEYINTCLFAEQFDNDWSDISTVLDSYAGNDFAVSIPAEFEFDGECAVWRELKPGGGA